MKNKKYLWYDSLFVLTYTLTEEMDLTSSRKATYFQNMLIQVKLFFNNKVMSNI